MFKDTTNPIEANAEPTEEPPSEEPPSEEPPSENKYDDEEELAKVDALLNEKIGGYYNEWIRTEKRKPFYDAWIL